MKLVLNSGTKTELSLSSTKCCMYRIFLVLSNILEAFLVLTRASRSGIRYTWKYKMEGKHKNSWCH